MSDQPDTAEERRRCEANNYWGRPCGNYARPGARFCRVHRQTEDRRQAPPSGPRQEPVEEVEEVDAELIGGGWDGLRLTLHIRRESDMRFHIVGWGYTRTCQPLMSSAVEPPEGEGR